MDCEKETTDECNPDYTGIENANTANDKSVMITGDTLSFPFDRYSTSLIMFVPYKNVSLTYIRSPPNILDGAFLASSNFDSSRKFNPADCKLTALLANPLKACTNSNKMDVELVKVKINFDRNFTILTIVIPMIAIFYLLGAIFIFESNIDQIGNRLALTLGIFALIFTLPDILKSMKPETFGPTIGDTLLSIIIIATIGFTISSIISSSQFIQKCFPRRYGWLDGIMFIFISGLTIVLLWNYNPNVTSWLTPILILGLGYGLLLKAMGLRINKTIWSLFLFRKQNSQD